MQLLDQFTELDRQAARKPDPAGQFHDLAGIAFASDTERQQFQFQFLRRDPLFNIGAALTGRQQDRAGNRIDLQRQVKFLHGANSGLDQNAFDRLALRTCLRRHEFLAE